MSIQKEISSEFIQEKYIQLLEDSYVNFQDKPSFLSRKKTVILLSSLALIGFIILFSFKTNSEKSIFHTQLTETTYNPNEILLESNTGIFYKLPNTNLSWLNNDLLVRVNTHELVLIATNKEQNNQSFTVHTPKNKTYNIILPDLSKININKNSSITCNLSNAVGIPNIVLKGEAFFNIAKQSNKIFKIIANNMNVEVIGTEFNISNYSNNNFTQLSLIEGSVKIKNKSSYSLINPGEQATLFNKRTNLIINKKDFSENISWTISTIRFKNKPLSNISKVIEKWYDVQIKFSNTQLKNIHFTGTLIKNKGLTHFIQTLKYTEGINYTINNKIIKLN